MSFPGSLLLNQGDIYKQTVDKRYPLGTRGYTRDGRVYRYARNGASTLTVGVPVQQEAPLSGAESQHYPESAIIAGTQTVLVRQGSCDSLTSANAYADGYMRIDTGVGKGQMVQIKSHTGGVTSATIITVVAHEGEWFTAAAGGVTTGTTSTSLGFIKNLYDDVIVQPATTYTGSVLGITPRAVTIAYYFWLQTWGPAAVRCGSALTIGHKVSISTGSSAGHAATQETSAALGSNAVMGIAMQIGATAYFGMVNLNLAP